MFTNIRMHEHGDSKDILGRAYEYCLSKFAEAEGKLAGEFYTPACIVKTLVNVLQPYKGRVYDPCCGSGGMFVQSAQFIESHSGNINNISVYGQDSNPTTWKMAQMNLAIRGIEADLGRYNADTFFNDCHPTLKADFVMANPPFAGDIKENTIISHYELGKNSAGKWQNKVGRDVLFIERNLNFLKPGGRMAIVLPQGRFNNSSDKYIREFIAERCRILAVVGLHGNVFKPHTGTKTSVLFVQKWDDELCPKKEDYPIFFATMQKQSKDNSGDKIYVKDPVTGENVLDHHGHLIVDHDLYSHDGLTPDGIAEAFIEFAKKEGLSFFR